MTEELGVIGDDDSRCTGMRRMSGDTPQSRVSRYKEERRKQLASQFAHLSRNRDDSSSSSFAASDAANHRKATTFKLHNLNTIQDDDDNDARKSKTSTRCKTAGKTHCKGEATEDANERKKKSNCSMLSDSSLNHTLKNNRDKSAKRKSYLNRSANYEKTPTYNHNHNKHSHTHYHSAEDKNVKKSDTRVVVTSSLPAPMESAATASVSALSSSSSSSSSLTPSSTCTSSHKPYPSPSFKRQLTFANSPASVEYSTCNGFAQQSSVASNGGADVSHSSIGVLDSRNMGGVGHQGRLKYEKDAGDKSRIPVRIASPSKHASTTDTVANGSDIKRYNQDNIVTNDRYNASKVNVNKSDHVNGFSSSVINEESSTYSDIVLPHASHLSTSSPNFSEFRHQRPILSATDYVVSNGVRLEETDFMDAAGKRSTVSGASVKYNSNTVYHAVSSPPNCSLDIIEEDAAPKPSILKNKFSQRSNSLDTPKPNSILKRKTFEEVSVAISPNGPISNNVYRQGILKKHSSLDEQEVRRRSCSPDVDNSIRGIHDFKPILKPHRRSSLEEVVRIRSPELHSILKRSKPNADDYSDGGGGGSGSGGGGNPHSILKRKATPVNGHQTNLERHSIDASFYNDASVDGDAVVKPILKNKQQSVESVQSDRGGTDAPRPILKKKQWSESELDEERPKKPILKTSRKSSDEEDAIVVAGLASTRSKCCLTDGISLESRSIRPILKRNEYEYVAVTRTVKSDDDTANDCRENQNRVKRHSLPGAGFSSCRYASPSRSKELFVPPSLGTSHFENFLAEENEIRNDQYPFAQERQPQKTRFSRNSERFKTQPITREELVSSQNAVERINRHTVTHLSDNMNTNDENHQHSSDPVDEIPDTEKTNDLDLISKLRRSNSVSMKASLFSQLEKDNKKAAEDQKTKKKNDGAVNRRRLRVKCSDLGSRFATQPVTVEEVAEAKKQNETARNKMTEIKNEILEDRENNVDSVFLSFAERIKLLSINIEASPSAKGLRTSKRAGSRFCTQPVTIEELRMAGQCVIQSTSSKLDANKKQLTDKLVAEIAFKHKLLKSNAENSSETGSQSEGDTSSSGGREIQSIILGKLYQSGKHRDPHHNRQQNMHCGSVVAETKDVVDECTVLNGTSSIAQRLAALQKSGQLDWKKRISRIAPENELSPVINVNETQEQLRKELTNGFRHKIANNTVRDEKKDGTLAERLEKLETARQTWKKRVEPSDAVKFSVAGKMASSLSPVPTPSADVSLPNERKKRGPQPSRFRSFREHKKDTHSVPTTPEKSKSTSSVCRSNSLPSEVTDDDENKEKTINGETNGCVVNVPQIFDEEFSTFFGRVENLPSAENVSDLTADFGDLKIDTPRLLPTHKKIRAQRKHATSGNPLKTMATRIEIKNEYREVKTNVAEKEVKRLNVEKFSKNSTLAVEALAGLASKEDFQAVQLKKAAPLSSPMLPYKPLMLLHIKGRRHVQTRLVKPVVESINSGDSYVLVTSKEIYHWIGRFANIIERSRGTEIAQHVLNTHDLGCSAATLVHTIVEDTLKTNSKIIGKFWKLLGAPEEESAAVKAVESGHPDEDEIYENALISTNMIYEVAEEELVPIEKYWGMVPKIQILDPNKVLVFDFGSELYVWMGKNVDLKLRKSSVKLAKELWENGFNYEECDLCPISSASVIGNRKSSDCLRKGKERPDWCLFAKVTQHMETILFREKFLDWPDFSRVIRQKGRDEDTEKQLENVHNLKPCDVEEMLNAKMTEPDLVLEGSHLGRGDKYFDNELRKYYLIKTLDVRMWHIAEFESEEVPESSLGQFYSTASYVIRWQYSISYTGRELSGLPSKHTTVGRDRCTYFCWQGKNASLNEQGAAALLTVELGREKGIQVRICQGYEPPAFFGLFRGRTAIYKSKTRESDKEWKLFICRGEIESEAVLLEVSCNIKQLRSRAAFMLINVSTGTLFVWHGCKITKTASKVCRNIVNLLCDEPPPELGLHEGVTAKITEIYEGSEPKEFFSGLGSSSRKLYLSLLSDNDIYDSTPMMFNLSSTSGVFCATPIWAACRSTETVTAYPFIQEDLYSASQPALFLIDTGKELWLWQGWWPEREKNLECDQTNDVDEPHQNPDNDRGSASVRWQAERRTAMQTALDYWKCKFAAKPTQAFLVWAGLEPMQFTNLFPDWNDRDDVAEMNILDGRKPGEMLDVEQELERLTQSTYPIEQLLQRPLPDGVDPTRLELYLSSSHFKEILKVTKEEFAALPSWKQTNLKKNAGLF